MNRKGFTLIELLATIVILGIVGGIATYGVISAINNSKLKSEKIFVDKISNLIDDYLSLYPPSEIIGKEYTFKKCKVANCSTYNDENFYEVTATQLTSLYINDLITGEIVTTKDLINPKNKEQCFITANPEIKVFKDSDYVYHYYVDLSGINNDCDIAIENSIINQLHDNLKVQVEDLL